VTSLPNTRRGKYYSVVAGAAGSNIKGGRLQRVSITNGGNDEQANIAGEALQARHRINNKQTSGWYNLMR
jgi:hypothetical protein